MNKYVRTLWKDTEEYVVTTTKKQCQELHSELSYMKENKKYFQAVEKTAAGNRLF